MQAMCEEPQSAHTRNPAGEGPFPVPARLRPGFAVALALLVLAALAGTAHAQEGGSPPLPIRFEGEVSAGGKPVASGTLTLRVGDWESKPVQVEDGVFRCCLIAGPPSGSYVGLPVTFHLDGEHVAGYTFDFPRMDKPDRRSIELVFPAAPGGGAPALVVVLAVGAGLLLAAGAAYGVFRRVRG